MVCDKCGMENAPLAERCRACGNVLKHQTSPAAGGADEPAAKLATRGALSWYFTVLKKYAVFMGRAGRREFWYFFLFNNLILIALTILSSLFGSANMPSLFSVLAAMYAIGTMVPALAVSVRRLHDANFSGWLVLLVFAPVVGAIILLVLCTENSKPGADQYGPRPRSEPEPSALKPVSPAHTAVGESSTVAIEPVPPAEASTAAPDHIGSHERVPPQPQAEEPKSAPMIFCTKCGAEGIENAKFCHCCGSALFRSGMGAGTAATSVSQAGYPEYLEQPTEVPAQDTKATSKYMRPSPLAQSGVADGTPAKPGGDTHSNEIATNLSKWVVPAIVGLVAIAGLAVALIIFRSITRYRYLKEGQLQYRVDKYTGRTDALEGIQGWVPVSFDRPAHKLTNLIDLFAGLNLTGGEWSRDQNQICFDALNNTDYALKEVTVTVSITSPSKNKYPGRNIFPGFYLFLRPEYGSLLNKGKKGRLCGTPQESLPSGANWSYTLDSAKGWKEK